jgi:hypothetical protein
VDEEETIDVRDAEEDDDESEYEGDSILQTATSV